MSLSQDLWLVPLGADSHPMLIYQRHRAPRRLAARQSTSSCGSSKVTSYLERGSVSKRWRSSSVLGHLLSESPELGRIYAPRYCLIICLFAFSSASAIPLLWGWPLEATFPRPLCQLPCGQVWPVGNSVKSLVSKKKEEAIVSSPALAALLLLKLDLETQVETQELSS